MNQEEDSKDPRVARRQKMQQISDLGHDPFGSRFDDRTLIANIRESSDQVKFVKEDGTEVPMPDFAVYRSRIIRSGIGNGRQTTDPAKKLVPRCASLVALCCNGAKASYSF